MKDILILIKPEKKLFIYGSILTIATSAVAMLFPQALKGLSDLANLKYEIIDSNDSDETVKKKNDKNS